MALTNEQILGAIKSCPPVKHDYAGWVRDLRLLWGRAIEAAATASLLERIAELEKWQAEHWTALEIINNYLVSKDMLLVVEDGGPEAAARNVVRSIAELEQRNRDLYEDVQRFKEHALSEKDARMALEQQLSEARRDAQIIRNQALEDALAEVEQGIWFDKTTDQILESIAAAIRAMKKDQS